MPERQQWRVNGWDSGLPFRATTTIRPCPRSFVSRNCWLTLARPILHIEDKDVALSLNVNPNVVEDAASAVLRVEVPKLPDALPRFIVKATVDVTMKDGGRKAYVKEVEIDLR